MEQFIRGYLVEKINALIPDENRIKFYLWKFDAKIENVRDFK